MSEPKIYTKNYVNADDTFTLSSGSANGALLYDRDKISQWISSGANSDSTSVTIDIAFYEGTSAVYRTFDTLMMLNHNVKSWTLYGNAGGVYTSLASSTTDPGGNTVASFTATTQNAIRLTLNATTTANLEKAIGELVIAALQLDIGVDMNSYSVTYRQKVKSLIMGDGSLQQTLVFWTANRSEKYEAAITLKNLSTSAFASLAAIKESGVPFLWYPESVQRPDEVWYVHWTNTLTWKYNSLYKGAGIDLTIQVKEV